MIFDELKELFCKLREGKVSDSEVSLLLEHFKRYQRLVEGENRWRLSIEKVGNGYIVREGEGEEEHTLVFSGDERETLAELLFEVSDFFGFAYNKFAKENLEISWDRVGHKIEEDEDDREETEAASKAKI